MATPPALEVDPGIRRVQLFLAARDGCRAELGEATLAAAAGVTERAGPAVRVITMVELDEDPFPASNPRARPFEVVLEVQAAGVPTESLVATLEGVPTGLGALAQLDLSAVVVGAPWFAVPCPPTPLRYLYLMRRKAGTTHEQYLDHYVTRHSLFGIATPGIAGYTQVHADLPASAGAAHRLGVGGWAVDSVSELHMRSLEEFFAAVSTWSGASEAPLDELNFVDRANSVSCCTTSHVVAPGAGD